MSSSIRSWRNSPFDRRHWALLAEMDGSRGRHRASARLDIAHPHFVLGPTGPQTLARRVRQDMSDKTGPSPTRRVPNCKPPDGNEFSEGRGPSSSLFYAWAAAVIPCLNNSWHSTSYTARSCLARATRVVAPFRKISSRRRPYLFLPPPLSWWGPGFRMDPQFQLNDKPHKTLFSGKHRSNMAAPSIRSSHWKLSQQQQQRRK